jgi:hypothetical protein
MEIECINKLILRPTIQVVFGINLFQTESLCNINLFTNNADYNC